MSSKPTDSKYFHIAMYVVIVILIAILVKVAIIDPQNVVEAEKYYKEESHLRMDNIKAAEILWQKNRGQYTDKLDSLVQFLKVSPVVDSAEKAYDTLAHRSADPFVNLSNGKFTPDSLLRTPKSHSPYVLQVDTATSVDTVMNRYGRIAKIDTVKKIGTTYYLEDPDGYGSVGSLTDQTKKNAASWEQ
jgi:hypothetical protein